LFSSTTGISGLQKAFTIWNRIAAEKSSLVSGRYPIDKYLNWNRSYLSQDVEGHHCLLAMSKNMGTETKGCVLDIHFVDETHFDLL
jgi:hypothetical protein